MKTSARLVAALALLLALASCETAGVTRETSMDGAVAVEWPEGSQEGDVINVVVDNRVISVYRPAPIPPGHGSGPAAAPARIP